MKARRRKKNRKLGLQAKIFIPIVLVVAVMVVVFTINSCYSLEQRLCEQGGKTALEVAKAAAVQLTDCDFEHITSENSDAYRQVATELRKIAEGSNVEYLYTIYTDGESVYYGVDATIGADHSLLGSDYEAIYEQLEPVFRGEDVADDYISDVDGLKLITAVTPVVGRDGNVIGVVGCDFNAEAISHTIQQAAVRTMLLGLAFLLASLALIIFTVSRILNNLHIVNEKVYDLANTDGDLTKLLEVKSGDELEMIADNINGLVSFIREIVVHIADSSEELSDRSQTLTDSMARMSGAVANISTTMEQMSAGMQETSSSLQIINLDIEQADERVKHVAELSEEGSADAGKAIMHANEVYAAAEQKREHAVEEADRMEQAIVEKIESSKRVERIHALTGKILEISSQTNLLALNASIEAARAGDAGRGFAVVADEIGKLASDSAKSAAEIQSVSQEIITVVDELAKESERMMNFLKETIVGGYDRLLETSEQYRTAVEASGAKMKLFADMCEQLDESMNHVRYNVATINASIEESAEGITLVATNTSDLVRETDGVNDEVDGVRKVVDQLGTEVGKFTI